MATRLSGRRRRRSSDDLGPLIAALGPLFVYDFRYKVSAPTGVVDSWGDAKNLGGSTLNALTTARPLFTAAGIVFDGIDDLLFSGIGLAAIYNIGGAFSLALVAIMPVIAGFGFNAAISSSSAGTKVLGILESGGASGIAGRMNFGGTNTAATSAAIASNVMRLGIVSKPAASASVSIDIPNKPRVTAVNAGGAPDVGNCALSLGGFFQGAGNIGAPTIRAVLGFSRQLSAGDIATLLSWAQTVHGAVAA